MSDSNVKVAVDSSLGFGGKVSSVVSGSARIVHVYSSAVPTPPARFFARTRIVCEPGSRLVTW